jgi:hypothetical protein
MVKVAKPRATLSPEDAAIARDLELLRRLDLLRDLDLFLRVKQ